LLNETYFPKILVIRKKKEDENFNKKEDLDYQMASLKEVVKE
jgi:hypothetical protein